MMRVIILAMLVAGCSDPSSSTTQMPPSQYQGDGLAIVRTMHYSEIASFCSERMGEHSPTWQACADINRGMYMPNPCDYDEPYARLLCHEIGHAQGWPADHGDG